ncbi:MAG: hypothetical protein IKB71_09050 [Lentisphaeria bacterium]|nr:hypothetical protein [Lentisphaeria bacterium]
MANLAEIHKIKLPLQLFAEGVCFKQFVKLLVISFFIVVEETAGITT